MSRIRSTGTRPEINVRPLMKALGFEYHPKGIRGSPDFADRKKMTALFIDGCFWHKCPKHFIKPLTNSDFWITKINKNVKRDRKVDRFLKKKRLACFQSMGT